MSGGPGGNPNGGQGGTGYKGEDGSDGGVFDRAGGGGGGGGAGGGAGGKGGYTGGGAGGAGGTASHKDGLDGSAGTGKGGGGGGGGGYHGYVGVGTALGTAGPSLLGGNGGRGGSSAEAGGGGGAGGYGAVISGTGIDNVRSIMGGDGGADAGFRYGFGGYGGVGLAVTGSGATITNDGSAKGGNGGSGQIVGLGYATAGSPGGAGIAFTNTGAHASLSNAGTVTGGTSDPGYAGGGGGSGVTFAGTSATLTNQDGGTITGGAGGVSTYGNGGSGGSGVAMAGSMALVTNSGAIAGGAGGSGGAGGFGGFGVSLSGSDSTLQNQVGGTITGGIAGTSGDGVNAYGERETVANSGTIRGGDGSVTGGNGVTLSGAFSTVTNAATHSIAGGSGAAGSDANGGVGIAFVFGYPSFPSPNAGGTVLNSGMVTGGNGADGGDIGGDGGAGVYLGQGDAALTNYAGGTITGGAGGTGSLFGGSAGAGVGTNVVSIATITNAGTITGGAGGNGGSIGFVGGDGLRLSFGGTVRNSGTIEGGATGNGDDFTSSGVSGFGLTVVNTGTIAGGLSATGMGRGDAITFNLSDSNTLAIGTKATFNGALDVEYGTLTFDQSAGAGVAGVSADATLSAPIIGGGNIIKVGSGTLTLSSGASTFGGGTTITAGTLDLAAASPTSGSMGAAGSGAISFQASGSTTATLALDSVAQPASGGTFRNTLADFGTRDALDLKGLAFSSTSTTVSYDSSGHLLTVQKGETTESFNLTNETPGANNMFYAHDDGHGGTLVDNGVPICFAAGTLIRTTRGDVAVEALAVGDLALTSSGEERPIKWLGHRGVDCRRHPRPCEVMPVRIAAHAFGANKPARDLYVSPGHSICVDILGEVLIPAISLVNAATVQQVEVDTVTYWHVELDSHDIVLAENLACESYLDMGNRMFFADGGVVALDATPDVEPALRTHSDYCRPFHQHGALVEAVRAQMRARASALGWGLSKILDVHLEIDGKRADPVVRDRTIRFLVPADAKSVWVVSPTAQPHDTNGSCDCRALGVDVRSLRIEDGFGPPRDIAADDPRLGDGFSHVEEGPHRWTEGRARLPAELWDGCQDAFFLRIDLGEPLVARWTAPAIATTFGKERRMERLELKR